MSPHRRGPTEASTDAALDALIVIDRLEVGPVRIEARRITTPYRVTQGGKTMETELIYRWGEDVFTPDREADRNLATMITAQLALNYSLFCHEITIHGPLDKADRRFLTSMAENTAREIYVKKFLEPNPFLVGAAARMPLLRTEHYSAARFSFPGALKTPLTRDTRWQPDTDRIAVLASGGKDSLLSLGLLEELGREVHSLFVNESGRHWYTALNAHRHLEETRPLHTARVWTSSDRLFNWMLRHLPFIRQDFARLRADEYPIRLWTVAIFLFGVLPLVRRRGLAYVVIGDEYDTTRRARHHGVSHYDGLYDQSRYFDDALSSYYRRKGWPVAQFSLLRQMSELLIQRTLARRYPELLAVQTSCHAAHIEEHRVLPCGRCEKCRRIVAMLTATGADPGVCGYSPEQIEACLQAVGEEGVHQELPAAQHLAWMLAERGILPLRTRGFGRARAQTEVVSLRFHPEASPVETVPRDLRAGLYTLLANEAAGSVARSGRVWTPTDPLSDVALHRPYRFELSAEPTSDGGSSKEPEGATDAVAARKKYLLGEMTWLEAKGRLAETDTALLPVGAIEQHGLHLPLDIDSWDAAHLSAEVAAGCSDPKPLVLPLISYGVSYHHDDFPGTLSVSPDTLSRTVYDVGMAAARNGITKLIIVNGHGGNAPTLQLAAQLINRDAHIFTCVDTGETSDADVAKIAETPGDVHAGEIETSTALATRPELVAMALARCEVPAFSNRYLDFSSARSVEWCAHTARISESGVLGDATLATAKKGEEIWRVMIRNLVEFVEKLKGMSLAEIHERHY